MRKERRELSAAFKAKVALEALQEKQTIAEIAAKYDLHSNQVSQWKKQLQESSSQVFTTQKVVKDDREEKLKDELYKQIGMLQVQNDWLKKNLHSISDLNSRKMMIDKSNKALTITAQCDLAGVSKSSVYYKPRAEKEENITLMNQIDELHTARPYYGARRLQKKLSTKKNPVNIKRVRRLMKKMALNVSYPKPNTSKAFIGHKKYPYLLRDVEINRPNQVWSMDITYIKMNKGYMYLTAVIDWHSRFVLSWKTSNSMTLEFCKECLQEAIDSYGKPEIFNTDQGSQFTSNAFISIWEENNLNDMKISMDGRGRATDNAFIERLW